MNLLFKVSVACSLLLGPQHLIARDKILITYEKQSELALTVKRLIEQDLGLPASFINHRYLLNPCEKIAEAIIQVCVANDGSILFPVVKRDILDRNIVPLMKPVINEIEIKNETALNEKLPE